jgi:hypothetical protein
MDGRPWSSAKADKMFNRTTSTLGVLCGSTLLTTLSPSKGAFARTILYPIFSSSRQDAKIAKKTFLIFFLGALCPVEYRLDQD